jgi:hypothetical protein
MERERHARNSDGLRPLASVTEPDVASHFGVPAGLGVSLSAWKLDTTPWRWRSSMVEQLICNQQVAGSSPIASSSARDSHGGIPERSKGTDCKSVAISFEGSNPSPSTDAPSRCHDQAQRQPMNTLIRTHAGVAQLVELQPSKLDVAGSRPVSRSAHVAQLAEHVLGKDEVTRSIRVVGSRPNR